MEKDEIKTGGDINGLRGDISSTFMEFKQIQRTIQTEIVSIRNEIFQIKEKINTEFNRLFDLIYNTNRNENRPEENRISLSNKIIALIKSHGSLTNVEILDKLYEEDLDCSIAEVNSELFNMEAAWLIYENKETNKWGIRH